VTTRTRWIVRVAVGAGILFALMGGEYSTVDWWTLERDVRAQERAIERLTVERDSLAEVADAIENDPFEQERAARELFGMARPGETLYRVRP
jgi:cell division protein FtsB